MTRISLTTTLLLMVAILAVVAACQPTQPPGPPPGQPPAQPPVSPPGAVTPPTSLPTTPAGPSGLKKFSSEKELRDFIMQSQLEAAGLGFGGVGQSFSRAMAGGMAADAMMESAPAMAPSAGKMADGGGAADYSSTNVQVAGVDEADFVKNDGQYIYTLTQDKLVIVRAYPPADAQVLSNTEIDGQPSNLFLAGDYLVVFTAVNEEAERVDRYSYTPQPTYMQVTKALVYDIRDRASPKLEDTVSVDGSYENARLYDGYVYLLTQQWMGGYYDIEPPVVIMNGRTIRPDIYYPPEPRSSYQFHTITAFKPGEDSANSKTLLLGYGTTLYMSEKNMFLAYRKEMPWRHYQDEQDKRFYEAVVPLLPSDVQAQANKIKSDYKDSEARWEHLADSLDAMYDGMDKKERSALAEKIREALDEYDAKVAAEQDRTVIHRIAIDKGKIEPKSQGEVPGSLLNQWSLDEYDAHLRVATTRSIWTRQKFIQDNNVYVLDGDLKVAGSLERLAEDERIYSTRFMGDRLYMVTFQRVDPLFVIDLADPEKPKVLGELKIPGFSDYLHPYDATHLIGIGKETKENEWGGVSIKGLKVALFDVSDVTKPKQVDYLEIGSAGTDSEALHEHKAFLFDKKRNLMVIPVREVKERFNPNRNRWDYYDQRVWQGAYVFTVTETGIDVKGKIAHFEGDESTQWYWGSPYAVRRSLYMDDVLYTVSAKKILAHNLDNLEDEVADVALPYKQEYYPKPYYRGGFVGEATEAVAVPDAAPSAE